MGEGCIFCSIVQGKASASVVFEDDSIMAFVDAYPVNPGHLLVIPKVHSPDLASLDRELGGEIFKVAMELASALRETGIRCEGINLILADGASAGQEVFHVHLHVIPRYPGDNFSMSSRTRNSPSRDELDGIASMIRGKVRVGGTA